MCQLWLAIFSHSLCAALTAEEKRIKTLIVYAYSQHTQDAVANVKYFLRFGVREVNDVDFVFVANGCHSIAFPTTFSNVRVVERNNTCFDFGAWGIGIEAAEASASQRYDFVIIVNSSVRGPFLPTYESRDWWRILTDQIVNTSDVAGTTINCMDLRDASQPPSSALLHLQSMVLAFSVETLDAVLRPYFQGCPRSKESAIYDAELPLSRAVLSNGGSLRAQLISFARTPVDDQPKALLAQICAELRRNSALGLGDVYFPRPDATAADVHPLEVIFFKTARSRAGRAELERLTRWAYFHAEDGQLRTQEARQRDFALPMARGTDCNDSATPSLATVSSEDASAASAEASRLLDVEDALRAANEEIANLRSETARLKKSCVFV